MSERCIVCGGKYKVVEIDGIQREQCIRCRYTKPITQAQTAPQQNKASDEAIS